VILHGTDTMAYTASALSFMLENLHKTVIVTGSMIPLYQPYNDGERNFLISLIIAGNVDIPEVSHSAIQQQQQHLQSNLYFKKLGSLAQKKEKTNLAFSPNKTNVNES
jgi:L-asparaginase/Glu-tRNA(Gln) amidotransferase subunit D